MAAGHVTPGAVASAALADPADRRAADRQNRR
jgi:hypothetical protein